jgi:hypothetical protein
MGKNGPVPIAHAEMREAQPELCALGDDPAVRRVFADARRTGVPRTELVTRLDGVGAPARHT